jgi:short-subunit dehydrogenase
LHSLNQLAEQIQSLYKANVTVISNVDLSKPGGAQLLYQTTKEMGLYVDVLILNAGVGSRGSLVSMDMEAIQQMVHLNVESTTILASLYGQDMKHHLLDKSHNSQSDKNARKEKSRELLGARIMIMSSIVGIVPGVPYASLYAASKAYLRSLSWGLAAEMQPLGIGVTSVIPGATASTNFASSSSISDALVWHYPWVVSTPDAVARRAVDSMERGHIEVFPGRALDLIFSKVVMPLLPPWFVTCFFGISWSSGDWLYRSTFFTFMKQLFENGDNSAKVQQLTEL